MSAITEVQKVRIDVHYKAAIEKLTEAIQGSKDFEPGVLSNIQAPCLIRSAIYDLVAIKHEINNIK